ncbi:phytoene/squalene synthase family protein [Sphingomonas lutea]|uniref:Phytoene/squalene synthase family protein n=1 Tax=Sphingomonas lutea TaxID=1045317 RepID=A0A7G9SEY7_9SPHN|nr:phytoene/squalene synthase family protein [Sphingomonas lutea]QNN66412.1 phytoene/squalene synthase family protein [Sphingomonas lutea]
MTRAEIVAGAREAIHNGSKSFRAASRLFDPVTRERSWLLYSWCRHCDDVADGQTLGFGGGTRGDVATLRAKTRLAMADEAPDELPFLALEQLLRERPIPARFIEDHLEGFALDESGWRPRDEAALAQYCYHVAGTVGCMMAIVMGVPADDDVTLERAADLGIAFQLSNILRDIRDDHDNGRCYLPADWLADAEVTPERLFDPENGTALQSIVARLVAAVETYEASARRGIDQLPFRSRVAVLTALRIYGAIGRRVAALGPAAWDRRVSVGKLRKLAYVAPSLAEATFGGAAGR